MSILWLWYINSHECLHSTYNKFPFGILWESMHSKIKPAFRINSMMSFNSIINTAETILHLLKKYMKLGHLANQFYIAWLKLTTNMNISLFGAKIKFVRRRWNCWFFFMIFIFIHLIILYRFINNTNKMFTLFILLL